ncbi:MAG: 1,4-dihydroxy-6-naphthoate synthase [Micromonosporaceae bacterium]|nr:1,4-dihydroxy-6-naphthoate synthase [Micromonosporaceae bacterium]
MTALTLAISPCPNDTFTFHALVHGLVPSAPPIKVTYADIDVTNTAAEQGAYDIVKVSYAALPWLLDQYSLLPCGGALGRGCGPLVLTASASGDPAQAIAGNTVAIPGERSTAYLLFRLWSADFPPGRIVTMPFHEIMPAVRDGRVAAGLVIHEARFTYQNYGLHSIADLGDWWEGQTGLPIPLGAILARRGLDAAPIAEQVRQSVRLAWTDPGASASYVRAYAQEMEPDVIQRHIDLYVNAFTEDLGEEGHAAAETLLGRAADAGLVPRVAPETLRGSAQAS